MIAVRRPRARSTRSRPASRHPRGVDQGHRARAGRRHRDRRRCDRAPRRCRASRPSSRWCSPVYFRSTPPTTRISRTRSASSCSTTRRYVRARDVVGARLRVSHRLPRPPAHGDHPGAARARVQPQPHHDRAERALPLISKRRDHRARQPGEGSRSGQIRSGSKSRLSPRPCTSRRTTSGRSCSCVRTGAGCRKACTTIRRSRARRVRDAAGRGRVRVLRSAQDDVARLRVPRLRAGRLSRGRSDPPRRPGQRRARRRAVVSSTATRSYHRGASSARR